VSRFSKSGALLAAPVAAVCALLAATAGATGAAGAAGGKAGATGAAGVKAGPREYGCPIFPAGNAINQDVARAGRPALRRLRRLDRREPAPARRLRH